VREDTSGGHNDTGLISALVSGAFVVNGLGAFVSTRVPVQQHPASPKALLAMGGLNVVGCVGLWVPSGSDNSWWQWLFGGGRDPKPLAPECVPCWGTRTVGTMPGCHDHSLILYAKENARVMWG